MISTADALELLPGVTDPAASDSSTRPDVPIAPVEDAFAIPATVRRAGVPVQADVGPWAAGAALPAPLPAGPAGVAARAVFAVVSPANWQLDQAAATVLLPAIAPDELPPADLGDGPARNGHPITLDHDIILDHTWQLGSSTHLNCQGHRLVPKALGTPDDSTTPENEFSPSVPEAAIYVNAAHGVTVRNCVIDGFDFGIVVANAKLPPGSPQQNRFVSNTISTRHNIHIVGADNNLIEGNTLAYGHGARGRGVYVVMDSDRNVIRNNTIVGEAVNLNTRHPGFPGWRLEQRRPDGVGLFANQRDPTIANIIIGGRLQQVVVDESSRQEGNVVEWNYIDTGNSIAYGVGVGENQFLRIEGNEIHRSFEGVHFSGAALNQPFRLPGYCERDPSRYGLDDSYCFIPGIDKEDLGPLIPGELVAINAGVEYGLILRNRFLGPFGENPSSIEDLVGPDAVHMGVNPLYPVIAENEIAGAARAGIRLGKSAAETAVITRNVIHDNGYGIIALDNPDFIADYFGAVVSLNDIVGSTVRAVGVNNLYSAASEFSDPRTLRGNYWGRKCDDHDGFRPFDPNDPDPGDSPRKNIIDSHAYGEPVAGTPDHRLLQPCRG